MIFVSLLSLSFPGLSKPTAWGSFQKCNHSSLLFTYATINNKGSLEQTLHFPRLLDNQYLFLLTSQVNNLCITTHAWAGPTFCTGPGKLLFSVPTTTVDRPLSCPHQTLTTQMQLPDSPSRWKARTLSVLNPITSTQHRVRHYPVILDDPRNSIPLPHHTALCCFGITV